MEDLELDLTRIRAVYEMLLAKAENADEVRRFAARHPGSCRIDPHAGPDEDTWVMLLDALDGSEAIVVGEFPARELRYLEPEELAAAAEGRKALVDALVALGELQVDERAFPYVVDDDFRARACDVFDMFAAIARAAFGSPLLPEHVEEFRAHFVQQGAPAAAVGCERFLRWSARNGQLRAQGN